MSVFITTTDRCISSHHSSEQFGDWHEDYNSSVDNVFKEKPVYNSGEEFPVDAEVGDAVFIVYMTYSTGDTFGRSSGRGEVLWAFKDIEKAKALCKTANAANNTNDLDNEYSLEFLDDDDEKRSLSNPAYGYFEDMSDCEIIVKMVDKSE